MAAPPVITIISPLEGATGVKRDAPIRFSLTDDIAIVFSTIEVHIKRENEGELQVFSGLSDTFTTGYLESYYEANDGNGWDFTIQPDSRHYWRGLEQVQVRVVFGGVIV